MKFNYRPLLSKLIANYQNLLNRVRNSKYTPFSLYLARWQASTPVIWLVLYYMTKYVTDNTLISTIVANFIGGCIFFFVDKRIFKK